MSGRSTPRAAFAVAALAILISGCSSSSGNSSGGETASAGVPAVEVCAGTLDASAVAALVRMSGTDRFDELTGTNDAGEPNKFSLGRAVKHLHEKTSRRSACTVYKAGDSSGKPLLEIDFSASLSHPDDTTSGASNVIYPLGVYAATGVNGSQLFFRCKTEANSADSYVGDSEYVKASMYSASGKIRGDSGGRDRMTVLNSVARALAKEAGCAQEADLPEKLPAADD
ncbi:hypothetical protein V2W30_15505 [Streptomyces sp. Q6]|uniref:Uncharacterized protein n=1 Tax=Streptomyces citrinus TaxID=3118173 RepID=A0ACD5ABK9_9ACTN